MSGSTADHGVDLSPRAVVRSILASYRRMGMSVRRYVLVMVAPSIAFAVAVATAVALFEPPAYVSAPAAMLAALSVLTVLVYPKVLDDRRRKQISQRFHLFLTHITVLSLTNIDRVEIFRTLAAEEEYGAIAEEMGQIVALVDTWNQSLEDACRMRANHTPSPLLEDFLERLAYTIGGGQELSEFLVEEQDTIIQQFVIRYESDLDKLDVMKELYLSMVLSAAFILVFAIILPMLVGVDPLVTVGSVLGLFVLVQVAFVYAVHVVAPSDPIWYLADTAGTTYVARVYRMLAIGAGLSLFAVVGVAALLLGVLPVAPDVLPLPIAVAIPVSPLIVPGLAMRTEEKRVIERDSEFPSFVRALGGVESVKQTSTSNVLESLRRKDFGALTENVEGLYKRLQMRIDPTRSWRLFAAETGSFLIQKFGDMYVVGRRMGGEPRELGALISTNLNEVLNVREQRHQASTTLIGVVYGLTAASTFSFFVGLEIVELLTAISEDMDLGSSELSFLLNPGVYDASTITFLLVCLVLVNAVVSAMMIKLSDRGHFVTALFHFAVLTWIGAVTAVVTEWVVESLIAV